MKKLTALLCILTFILPHIFAAEHTDLHIEGYEKGKELPSWAKDLRRAEIVTFGSLPFTTLGVTLAYSLYRYGANDFKPAYIPNPFPLSSTEAKLTAAEQIGIISTAAALSLAVGITDMIIIQTKRSRKKKADLKIREEQGTVIRIRESAEELPAEFPDNTDSENGKTD